MPVSLERRLQHIRRMLVCRRRWHIHKWYTTKRPWIAGTCGPPADPFRTDKRDTFLVLFVPPFTDPPKLWEYEKFLHVLPRELRLILIVEPRGKDTSVARKQKQLNKLRSLLAGHFHRSEVIQSSTFAVDLMKFKSIQPVTLRILSQAQAKQVTRWYRLEQHHLKEMSIIDPTGQQYGIQVGDVVEIVRRTETCGIAFEYKLVKNVLLEDPRADADGRDAAFAAMCAASLRARASGA